MTERVLQLRVLATLLRICVWFSEPKSGGYNPMLLQLQGNGTLFWHPQAPAHIIQTTTHVQKIKIWKAAYHNTFFKELGNPQTLNNRTERLGWWYMSIIPELRSGRVQGHLQLHGQVEASLGYRRPCFKTETSKQKWVEIDQQPRDSHVIDIF